ncbi:MotA/TolQ/ExbB proton channel family protein [bacterium]|nr:MotA/TolQ/ExbB proton channel family protein [bacterium]
MNSNLILSFQHSGWVGKAIVILLFAISVISWTVIIIKFGAIRKAERTSKQFLRIFRNSSSENVFNLHIKGDEKYKFSPIFQVYKQGCEKVNSIGENITASDLKYIEKTLLSSVSDSFFNLEKFLGFLATTAGVSPFIGLLGTVWGILNVFLQVSLQGTASIGTVAPGVAEALITTVAGLVVAIPALGAYNLFSNQLRVLSIETDNFVGEFLSLAERKLVRAQNL